MLPAYSTWPQDPSPPLLAGRVKAGPSTGETDEYQRVPSAGTTDEDDQSRVRSPALSSGMLSLQQTIAYQHLFVAEEKTNFYFDSHEAVGIC